MSRMRRVVPLIAALAALALPAMAHAGAAQVIKDCTDDEVLQGHYTQQELRNALAGLDADADEYTNCRAVIRQAQLALASSGGGRSGGDQGGGTTTPPGGGGSGDGGNGSVDGAPATGGVFGGFPASDGPAAATPAEQAAIADAVDEVIIADPVEQAGVALPTPLIGALAIGALALLVFVALDIRRRLVDRRGA